MSEFEDLAFTSRSSREPDEVGSEDMCEHGMNSRAVMMVAERHLGVALYKSAEFRRIEKNSEEMALKIWTEQRHPFRFMGHCLNLYEWVGWVGLGP